MAVPVVQVDESGLLPLKALLLLHRHILRQLIGGNFNLTLACLDYLQRHNAHIQTHGEKQHDVKTWVSYGLAGLLIALPEKG